MLQDNTPQGWKTTGVYSYNHNYNSLGRIFLVQHYHCLSIQYKAMTQCVNHSYKFANYTAWRKWRLKKKNHDPVTEHVAYALTWSFSHVSHQSGHDSVSNHFRYGLGGPQCCDYLEPAPGGLNCVVVHSVASQHVQEPMSLKWIMVYCTYLSVRCYC